MPDSDIGVTARVVIELSLTGGHIPSRLLPIVEELQRLGVNVEIRGPSPGDVDVALDALEQRLETARGVFKGATAEIDELTQRISEARAVNRFLRSRDV